MVLANVVRYAIAALQYPNLNMVSIERGAPRSPKLAAQPLHDCRQIMNPMLTFLAPQVADQVLVR